MSPKRLLQPTWWASHWPNAILYVAVCAVFVLTVWNVSNQSRQAREADLRACERGNASRALLLDFVLKASADPDPRQYEFITDPALREGVLDQARRGRAEQRERARAAFTPVDCQTEYPPT